MILIQYYGRELIMIFLYKYSNYFEDYFEENS